MAVYSGLVERLALSDDAFAHIMGHEIAHAVANHTAERMSVALSTLADDLGHLHPEARPAVHAVDVISGG